MLCDIIGRVEISLDEGATCAEFLRKGIVGRVGEFAGRAGRGCEEDYGARGFGGGEERVQVGKEGYVMDFTNRLREAVGGRLSS